MVEKEGHLVSLAESLEESLEARVFEQVRVGQVGLNPPHPQPPPNRLGPPQPPNPSQQARIGQVRTTG